VRFDFLKDDPPPATRCAFLVTNPPFSRNDDFRERQLLNAGYLNIPHLHGADAVDTRLDTVPPLVVLLGQVAAGKDGPPLNYRINRSDLGLPQQFAPSRNALAGCKLQRRRGRSP
jgi:hypothetical protein